MLLCLLLLSAGAAHAEVYKWIDAEGNVHYGDLPPGGEQSAEPVKLPGLSTYQSRPVPPPTPEPQAAPAGQGYTRVEIVQPEADSAVRANDQKVTVAVALEPALQPGHLVQVLMDGNPVGEPLASTAVELSGVYRGGHTLQARVVDGTGKVLAESGSITFTLRKATIIQPAAPNPPPTP